MSYCPVVVQFGLEFLILAIDLYSFSVKKYGISEIFLPEFIIAVILEELNKENKRLSYE